MATPTDSTASTIDSAIAAAKSAAGITTASTTQAATTPPKSVGRRTRKPVNVTEAGVRDGVKVTDAALKPSRSVYEMCGMSDHSYRDISRADYVGTLHNMNLIDLQDEAYQRGVLASDSRDVLLDRLETKFLQETRKFTARQSDGPETASTALRSKALAALARGR